MRPRSFKFLLNSKFLLLRKIYFFYNIYLRNFKYLNGGTQFNEDKYFNNFFKEDYRGQFVDLGCFHPTRHNNTFQFYKKNWKGINVDLNPVTIELFNFFRSKDININCAISNKKEYKKLYFVNDFSPLNTIDPNHLNFLKKNFSLNKDNFSIKKVKTENINNILKKYKFYKIDFLNIDLEGLESEIIQSINFKKYKINLICIEILNHNNMSKNKSKKIKQILKKNKFKFLKKIGVNSIYKNTLY
ncbi:FkbM family methyltransferase [Pelagibacterales bacterium SAG-MED13]|nr:FkbM family methyltransferase [Pelagibacterales bacterium SAG-MED13]